MFGAPSTASARGWKQKATGRDGARRSSSLKKLMRHVFQRRDPERMLVHARDAGEFLAARAHEIRAAAHSDFLNRLQAIRDESGADDPHLLFAFLSQSQQLVARVRLQTRVF